VPEVGGGGGGGEVGGGGGGGGEVGGGGGGVEVGAVTTTVREADDARPRRSRTVTRTYFVPAYLKVNERLTPVPSDQVVPPTPSSVSSTQVYVHGAAGHVDAEASNRTDCPVCGLLGLYVNEADGRARAAWAAGAAPARQAITAAGASRDLRIMRSSHVAFGWGKLRHVGQDLDRPHERLNQNWTES
jgi:hypothetical protein